MKTLVISICILIGFLLPISGYGQKANKLLLRGEIDKAIKYCEKKQGEFNCFEAIADYYFKNKEISNAEKYYLKSKKPSIGLLKIANYYFKNDDFINAEKYFNQTDFPNEGLLLIADTYKNNGKYSKAEIYYGKVGLLMEGLNRIADALFLDLNYSRAITYYERVGKKYSIEELEKLHKDIIEEKEVSGLIGLSWYSAKKEISIFNPRVEVSNTLYISYELDGELDKKFMLLISFLGKNGNTNINPYSPKDMSGYFHYTMSLNTITVSLHEKAVQAKELNIYLVDTEWKSSNPVSNIVRF